MSTELSTYHNALMGAFGSTVEVFIQHPLLTYKNSIQSNYKIGLNLRSIYKGVGINALTMGPLTAVQFAGFGVLYNYCKQNNIFESDNTRSIISSTVAGALSGLIAGPTELMIVQQQKYNQSFAKSYINIKKNYGYRYFSKGLLPCIIRESAYVSGYCTLTPFFEKKLVNTSPNLYKEKSVKTSLTASIISGLIAGSISHPFDTIKTYSQSHIDTNSVQLVRNVVKEKGIIFLYKGIAPRSLRIAGTFFILNECQKIYKSFMF